MKVIIAGSRTICLPHHLEAAIKNAPFSITEIVSGGARGADRLGEEYAREYLIPLKRYPADWDKHGRIAGFIRNEEMSHYADALIALWDGESRGTAHMIGCMKKLGKPVYIYTEGKYNRSQSF